MKTLANVITNNSSQFGKISDLTKQKSNVDMSSKNTDVTMLIW